MNFDKMLEPHRHLFAHKAYRLEPTLQANSETRTMGVLVGKYGVIFPYSVEDQLLGVDYTGYPQGTDLSNRKISALETKLKPYVITFRRLDGEYQATFHIKYLEKVAQIVGVRARRKVDPSTIDRLTKSL